MSKSPYPENCDNEYLIKLCELIADRENIVGECRKNGDKSFFYMCIDIPFVYEDTEQSIFVDLNIHIQESKLQAKFEGEIFALSTNDQETFMENILRIFSSGIEAYEEFNWLVSGPSNIPLPMLDNLPKRVQLRIGRFEPLGDVTDFGNAFMESLIELDGFIYFLLASLEDEEDKDGQKTNNNKLDSANDLSEDDE